MHSVCAADADCRLSEHCYQINRFVGATRLNDLSAVIVIGRDTPYLYICLRRNARRLKKPAVMSEANERFLR